MDTMRELDHRTADRIDVRLLWDPGTNSVWVTVDDERLDESLAFTVNGSEALAAFHHPYVYADRAGRSPNALSALS